MTTARKRHTSASKKRRRVIVHKKVYVRSKSKESGKNDTLQNAPTKVPSNSAVFRVKVKKK